MTDAAPAHPEANATAAALTVNRALAAPASAGFPVVGIGCSAGGLDALDRFFHHMPSDCGMAFVIVQHLAPDQRSALPELLQRFTRMSVTEASEGLPLQRNAVYVIPPNKDLSLLHGVLHLLEPAQARGVRLPIDFFLRTLADDQRDKAVAVILSGMGSDGVLGLRAIKEKAGLVLVQDPASAEADSMPRSAIEAGLADIVALAEELPVRLVAHVLHPAMSRRADAVDEARVLSDIDKVVVLLRDRTGNDFSLYKTNTLVRRIERRTTLHQLASTSEYVAYLRKNPQEIDLLFRELLIGVTNFFRDREAFEALE